MKRFLIAVLVLTALLGGCTEQPQDTTAPAVTVPPTTNPGLYEQGSGLEEATEGAVRTYRVPMENGADILAMGSDILLFTYAQDATTLTRLTGANGREVYSARLPVCIRPGENAVRVENNTLVYYDGTDNSLVFLGSMLLETERVALPEDMSAPPVISADLKRLYYSVKDQIRTMDLETGISGLLRSQEMEHFTPVQIAASGLVLEVACTDLNGNSYTEYIRTENGQTVTVTTGVTLAVHEDAYFATVCEDANPEFLFGTSDSEVRAMYPEEEYDSLVPLLSHNMAIGFRAVQDGIHADLFSLDSGLRIAAVVMPGLCEAYSPVIDAAGTGLWFVGRDIASGENLLCRWEFALSSVEDTQVYTNRRFTADAPDVQGLARCTERLQEMSNRFGLTLQLGKPDRAPEGYVFQAEYRVPAIEQCLDSLETVLSKFPEDFFPQLEDGKLTVELLRSIDAVSEDADPEQGSLAYWENGQGHIALAFTESPDISFCSALSHILDAHVYANSLAYDDWDSLNPVGFVYDGGYGVYEEREDGKWLEGNDRAFVDEYSKTFAREDRARIFAFAMQEGSADLFASEHMQKKLQRMCDGIRVAFGWKKDERTFLWEQYLIQ